MMELIPAIDIRDGKVVRLVQGDYERQIEYDTTPTEMVRTFEEAGAHWVHVVDLDGAREGRPVNLETIGNIVSATGVNVEVGGGIRDDESVDALLRVGAARIVIGTQALKEWEWFRHLVHTKEHENRIVLGLDARGGKLAVEGWTEETNRTAVEIAEAAADWPLSAIIYTDIGRDGMLLGPNLDAVEELARCSKHPVIASGGVTDLEDIRRLRDMRMSGVIVGRAIYERQIDVAEAVRVAQGQA